MAAAASRSVSPWLPPAVFVVAGALLVLVAKSVTVPAIRPEALIGAKAGRVDIKPEPERTVAGERLDTPTLVLTRVERLPVGGELRERLWLLDPRPLFLPDDRGGVGGAPGPLSGRNQSPATGPIPPALRFADRAPAKEITTPSLPASPAAAATQLIERRWFRGMARQEAVDGAGVGEIRVARVEVYRVDESESVAAADITTAAGIGPGAWRPLTLTVLVGAAGSVGHPTLVSSSGVDEVDERIRWIVGRELLPRLPLRPGVYRLEVGP